MPDGENNALLPEEMGHLVKQVFTLKKMLSFLSEMIRVSTREKSPSGCARFS